MTLYRRLMNLVALCSAALFCGIANAAESIEGMAHPWQLGFQRPNTVVMEQLAGLHHYLLIIAIVVSVFVCLLLLYVCIRFNRRRNPVASQNSHNTLIEIIWTVVPVLILITIAVPSFRLFFDCMHSIGCNKDGVADEPDLTLKVIGYQWYWNFEYPDQGIKFDSYMKKDEDLKPGQPRLLTADNPIYVPVGKNVRVLVTGGDVIHSFAMPSFGVKKDAVPGRLNETWFRAEREGIYYGQCSELCGRLHGFMPIEVHVVSQKKFDAWVKKSKEKFSAENTGTLQIAQQ